MTREERLINMARATLQHLHLLLVVDGATHGPGDEYDLEVVVAMMQGAVVSLAVKEGKSLPVALRSAETLVDRFARQFVEIGESLAAVRH